MRLYKSLVLLYGTDVPKEKPLQRLLGRVVESVSSEDTRDLSVFVLVEDDVAVILDEAALSERAVECAERVLRNTSKMRIAQKKLHVVTYGGVSVMIVLENLLDGFSYLGLVVL